MNFMLVDDDLSIRTILQDLIEDEDFGDVVLSLPNAMDVTASMLNMKHIDILIIDFLMPGRDGQETVQDIRQDFLGKIIMLSQVEDKELIGDAYESGVDAYITKPLNLREAAHVISQVMESLRLSEFANSIKKSLDGIKPSRQTKRGQSIQSVGARERAETVLRDLGLLSERGSRDLLDIVYVLEKGTSIELPPTKQICQAVAEKRKQEPWAAAKEEKAIEQRLRRTVYQAMLNIAGLGVNDFGNPLFENYNLKYFDPAEIRVLMRALENEEHPTIGSCRVNTRKFLQALWLDSQC